MRIRHCVLHSHRDLLLLKCSPSAGKSRLSATGAALPLATHVTDFVRRAAFVLFTVFPCSTSSKSRLRGKRTALPRHLASCSLRSTRNNSSVPSRARHTLPVLPHSLFPLTKEPRHFLHHRLFPRLTGESFFLLLSDVFLYSPAYRHRAGFVYLIDERQKPLWIQHHVSGFGHPVAGG